MLSIIEKQSATIESLSYPVVLRDTLQEIDLKEGRSVLSNIRRGWFAPIGSYDFAWRFINLTLIFGQSIFGSQYKEIYLLLYNGK